MAKIVRLQAENVKRLSAVEIRPDGNVVIIGGENGAGKTSVLDAITMALGGKETHCAVPVREGETEAQVIVELEDLVVTRRFRAEKGTTYLEVASRDGAKYPSPQAMLDKLLGSLTFDPLAFSRMKPAEQAATLRRLLGIDTTVIDSKRAEAYEKRTVVNREVSRLQARLTDSTYHADVPDEPVPLDKVRACLVEIEEHNRKVRAASQAMVDTERAVISVRDEVLDLKRRLEVAKMRLEDAKAAHNVATSTANALGDAKPAEDIAAKLEELDAINRKVAENHRRRGLEEECADAEGEAASLTSRIDELDQQKAELLASAEYPVEGMSFGEAGVLLNGIPFEQASSAEQLRMSVAVGLAMNPALRVMLVRDGSLLDDGSMKLMAEMAAEQDAQIWIERVGEHDAQAIVIEDGAVRGEAVPS